MNSGGGWLPYSASAGWLRPLGPCGACGEAPLPDMGISLTLPSAASCCWCISPCRHVPSGAQISSPPSGSSTGNRSLHAGSSPLLLPPASSSSSPGPSPAASRSSSACPRTPPPACSNPSPPSPPPATPSGCSTRRRLCPPGPRPRPAFPGPLPDAHRSSSPMCVLWCMRLRCCGPRLAR